MQKKILPILVNAVVVFIFAAFLYKVPNKFYYQMELIWDNPKRYTTHK